MSDLSDLLEPVTSALGDLSEELKNRADHLIARLAGKLDEEEKRLFAWVMTKVAAADPITDEPADHDDFVHGGSNPLDRGESAALPPEQLGDPSAAGVVDGAQGVGTVGDGGDPTAVDSGEHIA